MHLFKIGLATTSIEKLTIQSTRQKSCAHETTWILQHLFENFTLKFLIAMMLMPSTQDI
jgi:hypothetical protein